MTRCFGVSRPLICALLLAVLLPAALVMAAPAPAEKDTLAQANNQFAFDMLHNLASDPANAGKNVFFSPFSISTALGMTYLGSAGNTQKQMAATLHFALPPRQLGAGFGELLKQTKAAPGAKYKLSVANSLWGQSGEHFEPAFTAAVQKDFGGGFHTVDFADDAAREKARLHINHWVENETNAKIKDLLQKGDLKPNTKLVLTNAIYFKGDWSSPFKPERTQDQPFFIAPDKTPSVPLMQQTGSFAYAELSDLKALELPYAGDDLSMIVLLPNADVQALSLTLTADKLQSVRTALHKQEVKVWLPRFKVEARYGLSKPLADLGMADAFDESTADFSGISGHRRLFIQAVIHQAVVEVNEQGSEAAAATAVIMGAKAVFRTTEFRADRPFLFLILHKKSGAVLFLGRYSGPQA